MSIIPVEVPTGAIRFNTDSHKMECFDGTKWWEVILSGHEIDGGTRALFGGMSPNATSAQAQIDYINIAADGNAADFGNLSVTRLGTGGYGSNTRAIFAGGQSSNVIDYHEFASTGNFEDFGDLTDQSAYFKGLSNQTRGVNAGGWGPSINASIDYITIASAGFHAHTFGNLDQAIGGGPGAAASPTRGVFSGGYNPSPALNALNVLQYITIASTGNTHDFGDMAALRTHNAQAWSATRSVIAMGYNKTPSTGNYDNQATSEYYTFATLGNSSDFGDMINSGISPGGTSNSVRGVWGGGSISPNNVIQHVNIPTLGNSVDFGDLQTAGGWCGACSNGHGGL